MDVNNNIIRTSFNNIFSSESCFFGNAANVGLRCSVLTGESADVPEDIVVDWSLRYPRSATATPRKSFSVWTMLLCIAVDLCVFRRAHVCYLGPNGQIPRGRPSLLYDHINVILRVVV